MICTNKKYFQCNNGILKIICYKKIKKYSYITLLNLNVNLKIFSTNSSQIVLFLVVFLQLFVLDFAPLHL